VIFPALPLPAALRPWQKSACAGLLCVSSDKPERAAHGTGQQNLMIFLLGMMRINGEVTP